MLKRSIKLSVLTLIMSLLLPSIVFASPANPQEDWDKYNALLKNVTALEGKIVLAESTKLTFLALKEILDAKFSEINKLQNQVSRGKSTDSIEKDKEKINLLRGEILDIQSRLDEIAAIKSLKITRYEEIDNKILELKKIRDSAEEEIVTMKRVITINDPRFEKIANLNERKLSIKRKLDLIDTLQIEIKKSHKTFAVGLSVSLVSLVVLVTAINYEHKFYNKSKNVYVAYHLFRAIAVATTLGGTLQAMLSNGFTKTANADLEKNRQAILLEYKELTEQFDVYAAVIGVK